MDPVSRRLLKELHDFQRDPSAHPDILELRPMDDEDLLNWRALIRGTKDTPYEGGVFEMQIAVPQAYPIQPPTITFVTMICHPNVHFKTGEICLDILKTAWSPAWTLQSTLLAISLLLAHPEPGSPLNCDAANLLRCGDFEGYNSLVRMYTQLHAMDHASASDAEVEEEEEEEEEEREGEKEEVREKYADEGADAVEIQANEFIGVDGRAGMVSVGGLS